MVAAEGLHDRRLIQELDSLSQACRLIHRLHCYACVSFSLDDVLGNTLVDHAEGALTQFPQNVDLVSGHLPLVLLIHCRNISQNMLQMQPYLCHLSLEFSKKPGKCCMKL